MKNKFLAAIIAGAIIITPISSCSESHTAISISDTLSVAQRYLSEMKYEQAIIEFDKILEVEPKNVDAYFGKAEAYIALGDIESAIKALQVGYDQTGDERLKTRLEELTAPTATTTDIFETTTDETTTNTTTTTTTTAETDITSVSTTTTVETTTPSETTILEATTVAPTTKTAKVVSSTSAIATKATEHEETIETEAETEDELYINPKRYRDENCLSIENSIVNYLKNETPLRIKWADKVTAITILGNDRVFVECGETAGTYSCSFWYDGTDEYNCPGYIGGLDQFGGNHANNGTKFVFLDRTEGYENESKYEFANSINVEFLKSFPNLKKLRLSYIEHIDISPLADLKSLTHLAIDYCSISDLSPILSLTNLRQLFLGEGNRLDNCRKLSNLDSLECLTVPSYVDTAFTEDLDLHQFYTSSKRIF